MGKKIAGPNLVNTTSTTSLVTGTPYDENTNVVRAGDTLGFKVTFSDQGMQSQSALETQYQITTQSAWSTYLDILGVSPDDITGQGETTKLDVGNFPANFITNSWASHQATRLVYLNSATNVDITSITESDQFEWFYNKYLSEVFPGNGSSLYNGRSTSSYSIVGTDAAATAQVIFDAKIVANRFGHYAYTFVFYLIPQNPFIVDDTSDLTWSAIDEQPTQPPKPLKHSKHAKGSKNSRGSKSEASPNALPRIITTEVSYTQVPRTNGITSIGGIGSSSVVTTRAVTPNVRVVRTYSGVETLQISSCGGSNAHCYIPTGMNSQLWADVATYPSLSPAILVPGEEYGSQATSEFFSNVEMSGVCSAFTNNTVYSLVRLAFTLGDSVVCFFLSFFPLPVIVRIPRIPLSFFFALGLIPE